MVSAGHARAIFVAHAAAHGRRCGPFEWLDGTASAPSPDSPVLKVAAALRRPTANVVAAAKIVAATMGAEASAELCETVFAAAAAALGTTPALLARLLVHTKTFEIGSVAVPVESIPVPTAVAFRPTHIKLPPRSSVVGNAIPGSIIVVMATPRYATTGKRTALALHGHNYMYRHHVDAYRTVRAPHVATVTQTATLRHPGPSGNKALAVATVRGRMFPIFCTRGHRGTI